MSNPWNKVAAPADVKSLPDIMKDEHYKNIWLEVEAELDHQKILQSEFDKDETKTAQNKLNTDAELSLSFNYDNYNSDSEEDDEETASNDWEYFETKDEFACSSKQSHASKDKRTVNKNDIISSKKTASSILDERTRRIVCKLINDELIKGINGVISKGKDSIILHAYGVQGYIKYFPKECAIKVIKTTRNQSMRPNKFIKDDSGFKTPVELAHLRAEKENLFSRNLYFLHNPLICYQIENILVMPFIGKDQKPAPNLKDAILTPDEWQSAYDQVSDAVKKLYHTGRLIHGCLIGNNILWWENKCWFINFSRSMHRDHPKSYKFLLRDCHSICNFFKKKGVQKMKYSKEDLFEWITGLEVAHFIKN